MTPEKIPSALQAHNNFFATQQTKSIAFRKQQLNRLYKAIVKNEKALYEAFWTDLHKSESEAFLTEISIVLQEIKHHYRHLKQWTRPMRVRTSISVFPSSSQIIYEPLGTALIIAPWNYPFNLLMCPLVGAIAAGCCAMLKPSPYTPNVANVMERIITETFPEEYISIVQGNRQINALLLSQRFDFIFFTGSPKLGKTVMEAAAKNLTPLLLELGGKSPCIVDKDANLKVAARRIMWGKTINAGQTCIAPDYLFAHESIKDKLLDEMCKVLTNLYGENPEMNHFFPRIVNEQAIIRLEKLMKDGKIIIGGKIDKINRYIAPTIIDNVTEEMPVMQEEIFGPILPVMTFIDTKTVIDYVNRHEKPLAFYYFGQSKTKAEAMLAQTSSGGACINDVILHFANPHLPFGGVGNSGLGKYHHYENFLAFSNRRAVLKSLIWFDLPIKFPPFKGLEKMKRFLK